MLVGWLIFSFIGVVRPTTSHAFFLLNGRFRLWSCRGWLGRVLCEMLPRWKWRMELKSVGWQGWNDWDIKKLSLNRSLLASCTAAYPSLWLSQEWDKYPFPKWSTAMNLWLQSGDKISRYPSSQYGHCVRLPSIRLRGIDRKCHSIYSELFAGEFSCILILERTGGLHTMKVMYWVLCDC